MRAILWYLSVSFAMLSCSTKPSEKEAFYTVEDYQEVNKVDVHIHIFTARNDFMDIARGENFKVVNVALDAANKMSLVRRQFNFCQQQKKQNPSSVEIVSAFSMEGWDEPDWLYKNLA